MVADGPSVQMALLWMKLLERTMADCTLAFPELNGAPLQHLERKIYGAAKSIGHTLPTSTEFRKCLEIRNKRLSGPMREAISRALSHSLGTAQQYYQAPTVSDVYSTYSVMQDIIVGARAGSPTNEGMLSQKEVSEEGEKAEQTALGCVGGEEGDSPERSQEVDHERKRKKGKEKARPWEAGALREEDKEVCEWLPKKKRTRRYSKEQTELITKYFSRHIAETNFPTSMECREFVELYKSHFQDRTAKDIYDKCRNIAGR